MWLILLALFTALSISTVSAYFSIIGLTAIFAAAKIPIIILGSALEFGKIVSTLFVHRHWKDLSFALRSYLSVAIVILMLITSLGSFGFLSKAHLDQALPSDNNQIQLNIIDQKMQTDKDNITAAKTELSQLDAAVNQMMGRTTDATGAQRSVNIRKNQTKDRQRIADTIDSANKDLLVLQQQEAPLKAEQNKIAVEVGPIKYIADMIYGSNGSTVDPTILEKAVRIVIMMLVAVFDPLAIVLLLSATKVLGMISKKKNDVPEKIEVVKEKVNDLMNPFFEKKVETVEEIIEEPIFEIAEPIQTENTEEISEEMKAEYEQRIKELMQELSLTTIELDHKKILNDSITTTLRSKEDEIDALTTLVMSNRKSHSESTEEINAVMQQISDKNTELHALLGQEQALTKLYSENIEHLKQEIERLVNDGTEFDSDTADTIEQLNYKIASSEEMNMKLKEELENKSTDVADLLDKIKELAIPSAQASRMFENYDFVENVVDTKILNFGKEFPEDEENGDLFVMTSERPHKVYKWITDYGWIAIDKNTTDSYISDEYVNYLLDNIASGEYDLSELTEVEQQKITEALAK